MKKRRYATKLAHQLLLSVIVIIVSFLTGFVLIIAGSFIVISSSENAYNNAIIKQINVKTESTLSSTKSIIRELAYSQDLHDYLTPSANTNREEAYRKFTQEVRLLLTATNEIRVIIVQGEQGGIETSLGSSYDNRDFIENVIPDPNIKGQYFLLPYFDSKSHRYYLPVIMPILTEHDEEGNQERLGNFIILLDFSFFYENVASLKQEANVDLFLVDRNGEVVIGSAKRFGEIIEYSNDGGQDKFSCNANKYEIAVRDVGIADYEYDSVYSSVAVLQKNALSNHSMMLFAIAIACMIPSTVVIIMSFNRAKRNIAYSIEEIKDFMQEVNDENLENRMDYQSDSDYHGIYENINKLLDKYTDIGENLIETEKLKTQAELKMLKSQIDPHFLYNTLECIRGISVDYGAEEISDIVYSMAQILRYSLSGGNFSSIREELNIVRDYARIMAIRTKKEVNFKIEVDEAILELPILKMALQLIVENCFKHGVKYKAIDEIVIKGRAEDNFIVFEIADDGSGIKEDALEKLRKEIEQCEAGGASGQGMGLINIQRRLLLLYGKESGISVSQSAKGGFRIVLTYKLK